MHTTFPSYIISRLPKGEDGEITKLRTIKRRWVDTQYLGPFKVDDIEDAESGHVDETQRQEQARKELTLIVQMAAWLYEKYVTNYKAVYSSWNVFLEIDQQSFLIKMLPPPPSIPKVMHIECDEGDCRLVLWLAIVEYHITEPKPKISVLTRDIPSAVLHYEDILVK